jgi:uncharacterized protein YutE (UPF0331/DUF86 family)
MADMARFRNLLVHVYWRIDRTQVYETLPQRIETLSDFSAAIVEYLDVTAD